MRFLHFLLGRRNWRGNLPLGRSRYGSRAAGSSDRFGVSRSCEARSSSPSISRFTAPKLLLKLARSGGRPLTPDRSAIAAVPRAGSRRLTRSQRASTPHATPETTVARQKTVQSRDGTGQLRRAPAVRARHARDSSAKAGDAWLSLPGLRCERRRPPRAR